MEIGYEQQADIDDSRLMIANVKGQEKTLIFPLPQEIEENGERFDLNEQVLILIPQYATDSDLRLARSLVRELR